MKTLVLTAAWVVVFVGVTQGHFHIGLGGKWGAGFVGELLGIGHKEHHGVHHKKQCTHRHKHITTTTTTTIKKSITIYIPVQLRSYTWRHSILVHRHSADSPQKFHYKNTVVVRDMFPRGTGSTTVKGLQWAFAAGTVFRKSFAKLILDNNPKRTWARCSSHRPSTETTYTVLTALFPPGEDEPTNPIPVENVPQGHDKFTSTFGKDIPLDWSETYHITGIPGNSFPNIGEFMSYIRQQFDIPDVDDYTIHEQFLKPIISARFQGADLPQWVIDNYDAIDWVVIRLTQHDTPYGKMIYPLYGRLLAEYLADRLESIVNGESDEDVESLLSVLSYADINIQSLAYILNPHFGIWRPGFMGGLTMNVFRHPDDENDIKITMSFTNGLVPIRGNYNSMALEGFGLFKIPGCGGNGEYCSLTEFTRILRKAYQTEFDETQISCIGENAMV